ncbi:hypothetical protein M406DRAFT_249383 [Cryphonectria parasitica EP155]|uniref:Protein tweety homolog n=1 Tax=Cryphonectria parasitica (strain ATCC 38755 / EP155) TaxID=660469 RepID=A0A9P5CRJ1_CRYP1|nr:uncharacterized protein M406DRAFT_249383 [Cryphonectria parasitica EP155]KAF3768303.1 hypothetical protein M406DRAFT_249383 [Cryphonectria parasitica EP155]
MRPAIGMPIMIISLVLTMLALIAGKSPGFMEDYHILLLNTSMLDQNLLTAQTSRELDPSPTSCESLGGTLGNLCASATAALESSVSSDLAELPSIEDDIADKLAKELGIKQWYSLHVMNICQGTFTPNVTTLRVGYNVSSCTQPLNTTLLNISTLLDHQLKMGPLHLNLNKLGFTQDFQDQLNKIPGLFQALTGLYILAIAFSVLSLLLCIWWLYRPIYCMS